MPRIRAAEQALALVASSTARSQLYVCRACLHHALRRHQRTLHTTPRLLAEDSNGWLKRLQQSIFGTEESRAAEKKREEARQKRVQELANQPEDEGEDGLAKVRDARGNEYQVAALVDPSLHREYVPATSWEGLERVGGGRWVRGREDEGEKYIGFMQPKKLVLEDEAWKRLLHHVAVEVLALHQAGRTVDQVSHQRQGPNSYKKTETVKISVVNGSTVTLHAKAGPDVVKLIASQIPETAREIRPQTMALLAREAGSVTRGSICQEDDAWMQMPLSDPKVKFAITKRLSQLSGHWPRDAAFSSSRTLADLYSALKTKEKPKKLRDSEHMHALAQENPNVSVHARRQTPIDKHREMGRWKVIEDELNRRGLPVTGSRWRDAKTTVAMPQIGGKKKKRKAKAKSEAS